ncbi:EamA family transporter [Heliobacillus mobilis]|uniref:EamA family transporter n=1 Tax=Heliobacterium mobile TaxID=28064 RepID=A0A6I3SHE6_HELMO|nr:EamA family transporter [Heliobacterium mobile]
MKGSLHLNQNHRWLGFLLVLLASTLWGINGTIAKLLFQQAVSPIFVVQVRLFFTAVSLFLVLRIFRPQWLRLSPGQIPSLITLGVMLGGVQFTYLYTVSQTNVATAVFLQYTSPAVLIAYLAWRGKEKIYRAHWLGMAFSLIGGYLMVEHSLQITESGLMTGIVSAFLVAGYTLAGQAVGRRVHPWAGLAYGSAIGFIVWALLVPPFTLDWPTANEQWLFLLYVALMATLIPFGLYFMSLKWLPAATVGILSTVEPVVAAFVAWLVLQENLTVGQFIGAAMVVAGAVIVQLRADKPEKAVE